MPKLIIFDADGTMFDSHPCIYRAWIKIGQEFGRPNIFMNEKHFKEVCGKYNDVWQDYAVKELGFTEDDFGQIIEIWLNNIDAIYAQYLIWFEGIPEVINELERRGYTIAVATNNAKELFVGAFNKLGKNFPIHDNLSHKNRQKPNPHMIIDHMSNLGFSNYETVMVGDTMADLGAARNAEVTSIWAKYGSVQETHQVEGFYDDILERPECLLRIFE